MAGASYFWVPWPGRAKVAAKAIKQLNLLRGDAGSNI